MRRWLFALAGVVLLVAAGLGVAAVHLDSVLDRNRDAIAQQASRALGREVRFGRIGVSLRGPLAVRVTDLVVAEDPAFGSDPFLTTDAAEVRVALWPALHGRVEVASVALTRPVIRVVRTAQGLSTATLGGGGHGGGGAAPGAPASRPEVLVAFVDVEDGTIRYLDRTQQSAAETALERLDFRASDVTLDQPIAFELEAAVLASRPNLRASGRVGPASAAEPRLDLELALSPVDVGRVLALPALAGSLPPGLEAEGEAKLEITAKGTAADLALDATLDARGVELRRGAARKAKGRPFSLALRAQRRGKSVEIERCDLVVDETQLALHGRVRDLASPKLELSASTPAILPASLGLGPPGDALRDVSFEGSVALAQPRPRFEGKLASAQGTLAGDAYRSLALELALADDRLEVPRLAVQAFDGSFAATGSADLRAPGRPAYAVRADVDGMRLEAILASHAPSAAERATGRVAAHLELRGAGGTWSAIEPTLAGGGDVSVASGVLRGVNPAGQAMQAIAGLPVLTSHRLGPLLSAHPEVFGTADTAFETIASRFEIADREVVASDAHLVAREWDVRGEGRYRLDGQLRSNAVMAFSKAMSDELVAADKRLRFLRSREGRVEFPVVIRTKQDRIAVEPDLAYIADSASREAATELVDRALVGGKKLQNAGEAAAGELPPPPASPKELGRDLLRGLGGLLGGDRDAKSKPPK